jgi:hypothetical protein
MRTFSARLENRTKQLNQDKEFVGDPGEQETHGAAESAAGAADSAAPWVSCSQRRWTLLSEGDEIWTYCGYTPGFRTQNQSCKCMSETNNYNYLAPGT